RRTWLPARPALRVVACGGPEPAGPTAMLSDADLGAAEEISLPRRLPLPQGTAAGALGSGVLDRDARSGLVGTASVPAQGDGHGVDDLGGYVAYVEQVGDVYSIRIADLNDENSPEANGDRIV